MALDAMDDGRSLPALESLYEIPASAVEAFRRDGHVKLQGALTAAEITAYRPHLNAVIDACVADDGLVARGLVDVGAGWKYVKNIWAQSPVSRRFVTSRRLGRIAADLMGVDAVRLFRDQSYYKEPGGGSTPWHQDMRFIPLETDQIVSIWIPISRVSPDMAPMDYASGSHRASRLLGISGPEEEDMGEFEREMAARGFPIANHGTFEPGDVAVHHANVMHGSRANASTRQREVIVAAYFPDGTPISGDLALGAEPSPMDAYTNVIRAQNREIAMGGLRPGDVARGPALPLVYSRAWDARA